MNNWEKALAIRDTVRTIEDVRGRNASDVFTKGFCGALVRMDQQILGVEVVAPFNGFVSPAKWAPGLVEGQHYFSQVDEDFLDINGRYDVGLYGSFCRLPELVGSVNGSSYYTPAPELCIQRLAEEGPRTYPTMDSRGAAGLKAMLQNSLILDQHAATDFDNTFDIEHALHTLERHPFFECFEEKHSDMYWFHKRDIAKEALGLG